MANSPTDISTFSNEELIPKLAIFFSAENLLQHCFIEKQLETQVVFNFRQIDAAKIIILNNGKLQ